jgi:hypothetical protein
MLPPLPPPADAKAARPIPTTAAQPRRHPAAARAGPRRYLGLLEGRNPYALAHFANHPGKGMAANTVVASFSLARAAPELRAYLPNIVLSPEGASHARLLEQEVGGWWAGRLQSERSCARCQVLKPLPPPPSSRSTHMHTD